MGIQYPWKCYSIITIMLTDQFFPHHCLNKIFLKFLALVSRESSNFHYFLFAWEANRTPIVANFPNVLNSVGHGRVRTTRVRTTILGGRNSTREPSPTVFSPGRKLESEPRNRALLTGDVGVLTARLNTSYKFLMQRLNTKVHSEYVKKRLSATELFQSWCWKVLTNSQFRPNTSNVAIPCWGRHLV